MPDKNLMLLLYCTTDDAAATHATIFDKGEILEKERRQGVTNNKSHFEIFCGHCNKKELLLLLDERERF